MTQNSQTQTATYYDLTCNGIGFLNRLRRVDPKSRKSSSYFAFVWQASRGNQNEKTRFEVRVVGQEAKDLTAKLIEAYPELLSTNSKEHPTVVVGLRVGDLAPSSFEYKDPKDPTQKILVQTIDARVLKYTFIKVDGQMFYSAGTLVNAEQTTEQHSQEEAEAL